MPGCGLIGKGARLERENNGFFTRASSPRRPAERAHTACRASDTFLPMQLESRAPGLYPGGFGAIPNVGSRLNVHPRHLEVRISVFQSEHVGSIPIGGADTGCELAAG